MAADQQFCLRWNNHQSTLVSVFDTLLEKGALVDCTIAAEGQSMKAHKVVLSACSPYFETLLSEHYEKHPIIILKDVKFQELRALMDYMYRGEVNILQDQLASLLKVAESLQIKGLSDSGGGDERETMQDRPEPKKQSAEPKKQSAPTRPQPISRSRLETENRRPSTGFSNPNEFPVASPPSTPKTPSRNECSSPIARKRKKVPENSLNDLDTSSGFDGYDNSSSNELPPQKPTVPRTPMKPVPPATKQPVPLKPVVEKSAPSTFTQVESPRPKPTQTPSAPIEQDVKPPKLEPPAEVYIQPKTEFVEEEEEEIEDLTLDDEDDFDMSDQAMAGPSHGGDGSNQGFLQWHDQSQDEMFSAAQEAIGGQKDSQDLIHFSWSNYDDRFLDVCETSTKISASGGNNKVPQITKVKASVQTSSERGKFPCPNCYRIYSWRRSLTSHMKHECGKEPRFKCTKCEYKSYRKSDFKSHVGAYHSELFFELFP